MNKTTKIIIGVIVAVLLVWIVVANNGSQNSSEIKVGVILPLSGDAASYGEPWRNVFDLATEEINNAGGIDGKKLVLVVEDGKCAGKEGASAMEKLANIDKVQVVLGGSCSGESLGAEPIATKAKVLLFSAVSSSPDLTGKSKFFVRDYPSDSAQSKVLAELAIEKGWNNVAFIQEQTDFAVALHRSFTDKFQAEGRTVSKEEFPKDTADFRTIIAKVRASKPDAVFVDVQTAMAGERIFKQMQEINWKPNLMLSDPAIGDSQMLEENKVFLEGAFGAEFVIDPSNTKLRHLLDAYKAKYGKDVEYQAYAQAIYDQVYLLKDGIEAVGYNGGKLADWLRTVNNWQGASGSITIGTDGDRVSAHSLEVVRNGKAERVIK